MKFLNFWTKAPKRNRRPVDSKRLRIDLLEDRRMLAIVWANEFATGTGAPDFDDEYLTDEVIAREIVNRAIDDWNAVITDQNFDNDDDPLTNNFQLSVFADDL